MKKPITPGALLKHTWNQDVPKYYMYIETKPIPILTTSGRIFYKHCYLKPNGKRDSIVDSNECFFVENYNWLERANKGE